MAQVYQTYVTQIDNNLTGETRTLEMLEQFSPVASEMSFMALNGLQGGMKKEKLNSLIQTTFGVNKRHANSVINFVTGELSSASESQTRHIDTLNAKLKSVKAEIERLNKRLKNHREYAQAVEKWNKAIKYPQKTKQGKLKKIPLLKKTPSFDNACPVNGKTTGKTYLQLARTAVASEKASIAPVSRPQI